MRIYPPYFSNKKRIMTDIELFFAPVEGNQENFHADQLAERLQVHREGNFPELTKPGVALIYVPEFRNGIDCIRGKDDSFRDYFYRLFPGEYWQAALYDLGNLLPGEKVEDTYFALAQTTSTLVKKNIVPIVVGGSIDLTFALYKAYEQLEQLVNITTADSRLNVGTPDQDLSSENFISHILMQRPCYLFNYSNIGYQSPLSGGTEKDLFEKLYFDYCRLGEFNQDFKKAEPYTRNSDIFTFHLGSIRHSDFPTIPANNPNGFYADQACQIARYAGISDKLSVFGLFGLRPQQDQAAAIDLIAQLIWYFIEGYMNRKGDFPVGSKKDYVRFAVHLDDFSRDEIIFYKSHKSGRWWMEVPYPPLNGKRYLRHHLVPCDYDDYQRCMNNEVPDLWWKTYQKLE